MKFRDPTPEELEEFEKSYVPPPKPVEEKKVEDVSGPSDFGDLLKGTAQGATLGFGDEILAALQATISSDQKSWLESYREKQRANEAAYQEAQERSPWLTGLGEVAGGFALPVGSLLKGAKAGAESAKLAGMALGGAEAAKKAQNAYNVMQAAKTGAIVGGVAGLGTSEGAIEESPSKLASDVASGALFGGVLGGVGTKAGQALSDYFEKNPNLQRAARAMGLEMEGKNLGTEEGQKAVNKTVDDAAKDTTTSLLKTWEAASEDLNEKISKIGIGTPPTLFASFKKNPDLAGAELRNILKNNRTLNIAFPEYSDLRRAANSIGLTKYRKDPYTRQEVPVGQITLSDLLNLKDDVKSRLSKLMTEKAEIFVDPLEREEIKKIPQLITKLLKEELGEGGLDIYEATRTKARMAYPIEALLNDTADVTAHGKKIKSILKNSTDPVQKQNLAKELQKAIYENIQYSSGTGSRVVANKEFLKDLTKEFDKRLKESIPTSPILEDAYNFNEIMSPDKFLKRIEDAYKDLGAMQASEGMMRTAEKTIGKEAAAAASAGVTGLPISFGEETITSIGGKLGRLENALGKPVTKTRDLIKTYGVDKLKSLADTMRKSNSPAAKQLGESAFASLDNADAASRAAFINSIMQNPDLRKMLDLGLDKKD